MLCFLDIQRYHARCGVKKIALEKIIFSQLLNNKFDYYTLSSFQKRKVILSNLNSNSLAIIEILSDNL